MMGTERTLDGHDRGREEDDRLSRGRPRHRRAPRAGVGPDPQGDDHPARPRAGHGHAPAGARQLQLSPRQDVREPRRLDGRPRRRGSRSSATTRSAPAPRRTSAMRPASPATWSPAGACRTRSGRCNMPRPTRKCSSAIRSIARRTCRTRPRRRSTRKSAAIVEQGYDRAKILLEEHRDELETLAQALLEYETLSGDEIKTVLDGGTIDRGSSSKPTHPGGRLVDPEGASGRSRASAAPAPAGA